MEMRAGALPVGDEADCYDTVEWAPNLSGSDGNVGMADAPVILE
jgi:predicted acyl esterase